MAGEADTKNSQNASTSSGNGAERMDLYGQSAPPSGGTSVGQGAATTPGTPSSPPPNTKTIFTKRNRFLSALSRKRVLPVAIVAVFLVGIGTIYTILAANDQLTSGNNSEQATLVADIPEDVLAQLPNVLAQAAQSNTKVTINGPLELNNALTITPSDQPDNAGAGLFYFDIGTNDFMFHDGAQFQTVTTMQDLEEYQTLIEAELLQNTQAVEGMVGELVEGALGETMGTIVGQVVQELQDAQKLEITAGDGINVEENDDGYKITSTGVIELQGTPNQVVVSAATGKITVSLPQDIHKGATPEFAGMTLGDLDVSGTAAAVDLVVSGAASVNELTLTQALGIASGGTGATADDLLAGGVMYYNGDRLATTAPPTQPGLCFVSGTDGPEFVTCDSLAGSVSSINGLTGAVIIANADTSGNTITLHDASQTRAGLVSTTSQRFAGLKTFAGGIELGLSANLSSQGSMNIVQANFANLVLGNSTGNIVIPAIDCSAAGNGGKLTLDANGVLLCAEDTGGDGVGVASISASDSSIYVDITDGANPKIAVNVRDGGGLETDEDGLGLLATCTDGQTLKYDADASQWECADDFDTQPTDECPTCVALQTETPGEAQEGHINITGKVISGSSEVNGPVLMKGLSDAVEAFDLQNAAGASLISGNTLNMKVTIGSLAAPSSSELTGELPSGSTTSASVPSGSTPLSAVAVSGDYAFVTIDGSFFYVFDVSDPTANPSLVLSKTTGTGLTSPIKMIAASDYLYILDKPTSSTGSLRVYDVSSPTDPQLIKSVATGNYPVDMVREGNYIFIVSNESGSFGNDHIYTFDISDPVDPVQSADFVIGAGPDAWPTAITIYGTNLYVTERASNRIMSFDASDPNDIAAISTAITNTGPADISIFGNRAYVINSNAATMQTFDISNPSAMLLKHTTEASEIYSNPTVVHAHAGYVIVITYYGGPSNAHGYIQLYNTRDPDAPELVGSKALLRRGTDMVMQDGVAYIANTYPNNNSLQTMNLGNGNTTLQVYGSGNMTGSLDLGGNITAVKGTFSSSVTASNIFSLGVVQSQTFDANILGSTLNIGSTYANAINLNQNTTIGSGKTLSVQGSTSVKTSSTTALKVSDSTDDAYLVVDTEGKNIDLGSVDAPTENSNVGGSISDSTTGKVNISSLPNSVAINGDYAYVASSIINNVQIVDISDPESPQLAGSAPTMNGAANDIAVSDDGSTAYVAVGTTSVEIYDVSDPDASPSLIKTITTRNAGASVQAVAVKGNYLYVAYIAADNWSYIDRYDVTDPENPATLGTNPQTLLSSVAKIRLDIVGDRLYAVMQGVTTNSGLRIYNISNPLANSLPFTNHNMTSTKPAGIAVSNGLAYIPFVNDSTLRVYDVSTIAGSGTLSPVATTPITSAPSDLVVSESGKYLYMTDESANILHVLNIDDTVPQSVGTVDVSDGNGSAKTVSVATKDGIVAVVNNSRSNLMIVNLTGSAPRISLNQNTVLYTGRTFTSQGVTTVKTDSETAFRVQDAAGNDVLRVDTENGVVIAGTAFAVGEELGIDVNCGADQVLQNVTVVGGIVTAGTCGGGSGEGGGDEGGGEQFETGPDGGILVPSIDTEEEGQTLVLGPNNAALISLNQDTELGAGKSLTVSGTTTLADVSMTSLTVADAEATQYLTVDTEEGVVTIGSPKPPAAPEGAVPGSDLIMGQVAAGQADLDAAATDMIAKDNYVYVTYSAADKLETYQISESGIPNLVDTLSLTKPEYMAIEGTRLFVTTDDKVYEIDITTPGDPVYKWATGSFSAYGTHASITVSNGRVYSLTSNRGMVAYNATNPASTPTLSGGAGNKVNGTSRQLAGAGNSRVYAVDDSAGFQAVRIFNADGQVNQVGYFNLTAPADVTVHGDYLYVTSSPSGTASSGKMEIYEIATTPNTPEKLGEVTTDAHPIGVIISDNGKFAAIINSNSSTYQAVDITDPENPISLGTLPLDTEPTVVAASGDYAYVISDSGQHLDVFRVGEPVVSDGPAPDPEFGVKLNSNVVVEEGNAMHIHGDTTVRTDSSAAFQIQNAAKATLLNVDTLSGDISIGLQVEPGSTDPVFETLSEATALSTTSTGSDRPSAIARKGNHVYLAMRNSQGNKILTYDISDPEAPQETGSVALSDPLKLAVRGDYLYAISPANLYVLSLADPAEPALVATLSSPGSLANLKDLTVTDTHVYIYDGDTYKIATIDITNPESPTYKSLQPGSSMWTNLFTVGVYGTHAYAIDNFLFHKMFIFDLADPDNPSSSGELALASGVRAMAIYDHHLYIHNGTTKVLEVYDLTDPANPAKLSESSLSVPDIGTAQSMVISEEGKFAAIVDSASGGSVHIIDLTNTIEPAYVGAIASASPTAVTTDANNMYVVSNSNQNMIAYKVSSVPVLPEQPNVTLNNNTVIAQGQTLTVQGNTTVKTDSEAAFSVQAADGSSIFTIDTVNGHLLATGALQVDDDLTVTGATTLASLTVSEDATFLANIIVNGHVVTGGDAPSAEVQAAAGTSASCDVTGNDTSGSITLISGTDTLSDGDACVITFNQPFDTAPRPIISPIDKLSTEVGPFVTADTTTMTLGLTTAPSAEQTYQFNYWNPQ